jgi:competence protein ComEC
VAWGSGGWSLVVLTGLCLAGALVAPRVLRRRWTTSVGASALVLTVALGVPELGWPPSGWVLAACDVGQGDALVLNAGSGRAVVIDVGPDPRAVGRCLDRLEVTEVPLLVLTHFHADHVDGLAGVVAALPVGEVMVSPLADPPEGSTEVHALARSARVPVALSVYANTRRIGPVTLQVLWPLPDQPTRGPGDGSTANDASIVLLARVRGVDVLLTGDIEPPAQAALARTLPALDVDVLKVPHHGSRHQDLEFLTSRQAAVARASVGADNNSGHPATSTLSALAEAGTRVLRTDREGDLVVMDVDGRLLTDTSR